MLEKVLGNLSKELKVSDYKDDWEYISDDIEYHIVELTGDMSLIKKEIIPRLLQKDFSIKNMILTDYSLKLAVREDIFPDVVGYFEELVGEIIAKDKTLDDILTTIDNLSTEECKTLFKNLVAKLYSYK